MFQERSVVDVICDNHRKFDAQKLSRVLYI